MLGRGEILHQNHDIFMLANFKQKLLLVTD